MGAATRSVLPLVDGSYAYLDEAELPGPDDATSVGVFVEEWDDGIIGVGNGHDDAHWVRDDLLARAMAIEDLRSREITVLLSADLYMIFHPDVEEIRARTLDLLPPGIAKRTTVAVMTTHNHHGPDTAWTVNPGWYEHMMDQAAAAAAEAVTSRRPATLRVAEGEHWFGMGDTRDAQIIDPTMNVLQATATNGEVIATAIQWNNHPEVTLGWTPPEDRSADCDRLGEGAGCTLRNRYFTADYVGHLANTIEREVGGTTVYFVGALGALIAPLRVPMWEVDTVGLGDHYTPPAGAVPAGGEQFATFTEGNFRRAAVLGEQAALAALRLLDNGEDLTGTVPVVYQSVPMYTRLSNIGFRHLLVVDDEGRTNLGYTPGMLYTCPATGAKTADTCHPDDFAAEVDPMVGPIRVGDHMRTEVAYLRIGPVGMIFMPGEVASELVIGLPAGFDADPARWFEGPLNLHAAGDEYELPGYVRAMMPDRYKWTIGMGNDEVGYIVPLSDYRIACVAGAAACRQLHAAGFIDHPDGVSGEQCKAVTEDPRLLEGYPASAAEAIAASCRYGQAFGRAESHYEETMSAGWDLAEDMLDAVAALTGVAPTGRINSDFAGHWRGFPPPAE
ncbi:hypothetical protein [Egicoccus sp. AB-alg2]|uniref:hypothetical protein n=1 Tax=Egicoccus sp. AB-alg2 TaxID=3242693 RepID=UPI00359CC7A7